MKNNADYSILEGKTILIADDEDFIRRHIARSLTKRGMNVLEAGTGHEVLDQIREKPDIILLDVKMPDMDGFETTVSIRENPEFSDIPLILITARAQDNDRDKGLSLGATDYLLKPITFEQILEKIKEHITK
jgi:two-component system chemotaxis sensor kinase CheA